MFDSFTGNHTDRPPVSVVDDSVGTQGSAAPSPRQDAAAQALIFAVGALAAAGAFAIIGLTTVVMAVAIPAHLFPALAFTGVLVLVAIATGLATLWMRGPARRLTVDEEALPARGRRLRSRRRRTAQG